MATNPGPPLLFSLSRYTAEEGWRIVINGHYLNGATKVEIGGVAVRAADILSLSPHRLAIVVPVGAKTGTIRVVTPQGQDVSKFILRIEPLGSSQGGSRPSPPRNGSGGQGGNGGSGGLGGGHSPYDDDDFDIMAAFGTMNNMLPRSLRPTMRSVGALLQAYQGASNNRPFARNGNWMAYGVDRSAFAQWNRARASAPRLREMYQRRLDAVTADPAGVDFEAMDDEALQRAAAGAQGLPNGHTLRYERGTGWIRTNTRGRDFGVHRGRIIDSLRDTAANDIADAQRNHLQRRIDQVESNLATRRGAAIGAAANGAVAGYGIGQGMGTSGILSGIGGAIGTLGGPLVSVIGSVVGGLVERLIQFNLNSIRSTFGNIGRSGQLGNQIVENVLGGVRSFTREAYEAGVTLTDSVLRGVVSTMGPRMGTGGQGAVRFAGTLMRGTGRILEQGFDAVGVGARGLGRVAGVGMGLAAAGVGGVVGAGMVAGGALAMGPAGLLSMGVTGAALMPTGAIVGALVGTAVAVMVGRVVAGLTDMGGRILGAFGRIFGELGGMVGQLVNTVVGLINEAREAFSRYAEDSLRITNTSGLSLDTSQRLLNSRQAFGMNSQQTSGIYSRFDQMPLFQGAMKAAWGVRGDIGSDEEFNSIIQRARSLPLMIRRAMLQSMPEGEDFWSRMMGMPQEKINSQQQFFKGFELPSGVMRDQADDLFLLTQRWEGFYGFLMRVLGSALMPMLTRGMTAMTNVLKQNQGEIGEIVRNIGRWFYVNLPSWAGVALTSLGQIFQGIVNVITGTLRAVRHSLGPIFDFINSLVSVLSGGLGNALSNALRGIIRAGLRNILLEIIPAVLQVIPGAGRTLARQARRVIRRVTDDADEEEQTPLFDTNAIQHNLIRTLGGVENRIRRAMAGPMAQAQGLINYGHHIQHSQGEREREYDELMGGHSNLLVQALDRNTEAQKQPKELSVDVRIDPSRHFFADVTASMVSAEHRALARRGGGG